MPCAHRHEQIHPGRSCIIDVHGVCADKRAVLRREQVVEMKQRLVRAKKQVMALKKQAADAAEERDAALTELAALRETAGMCILQNAAAPPPADC